MPEFTSLLFNIHVISFLKKYFHLYSSKTRNKLNINHSAPQGEKTDKKRELLKMKRENAKFSKICKRTGERKREVRSMI